MSKFFTLLLGLFLAFQLSLNSNPTTQKSITEHLSEKMASVEKSEFIRINITLKEQFDSQNLIRQAQSFTSEARRAYVVSVLKDFTELAQSGVVSQLNDLQRNGSIEQVTTYWIANVVNCYAKPEAIEALAKRNDIAEIDYDEERILLDPDTWRDAYAEEGNPDNREITWNVLKINAQQVWALGYTGEGVVVAVIDTGVNYNHVDLADHVWQHPNYPYHGYNFVGNNNNPMDDQGHGTHCAGTVAGNGTAGSQTGVAPDATIMCLKVLNSSGGGSESGVWSAIQFSVEHGAHVMSLSLGWQHSWGPNRTVWRQSFDNALAAGVVAAVAAGNEGDQLGTYPIPDNVRTPGDVPPPWLNPDQTLQGGISGVICVGSTTSADNISGFSSRGPVTWSAISSYNDFPYQPGIGLIRPDVVAPGSNIKSLAHYSNTGYESGWSGTSMATPAMAGMMALMLQKNIQISPEQISEIAETTTVVLTPGKNNTSGSGRINALAAFQATPMPGPSYESHNFNDATGNANGEADPGENILLTLALSNFSDAPANNVTVQISTESEYINITDDSEFYGDFAMSTIIEMEDAFAFEVANNIPGGTSVKINVVAFNDNESWTSSFSFTANGVLLQTGNVFFNDASGNNNGVLDPGETANVIIQILNNGQIDAPDAMAMLSTTNQMVTINNATFDLETLAAGQITEAVFNITINAAMPVGSSFDLILAVESGFYSLSQTFFPKVGLILEDFETGDFNKFDWAFAGNANWTIVSTGAYQGTYAAKSGVIGNSASSELKITIEVSNNDSISFYRKVSSEADYDYLKFYVGNTLLGQWAGEVAWGRVAFPVTAGVKTFRWVYQKDAFVVSGSDCAWIDYIELPAMVDETMTAYAGADATICEGLNYQLSGVAQNYETLLWETSGDGTFSNATIINPMYYPGENDWTNGQVALAITANGSGNSIEDEMMLTFMPMPEDAGVVSGADWVCVGWSETYTTLELANAGWYNWAVEPQEAGTITGNSHQVVINWSTGYIGEAVVKVQGENICGQGAWSQEFVVEVDACTSIDELISSEITIHPNPNHGNFVVETSIEKGKLEILDITGKIVHTQLFDHTIVNVNTNFLENGIYFLRVGNELQTTMNKLIINK